VVQMSSREKVLTSILLEVFAIPCVIGSFHLLQTVEKP